MLNYEIYWQALVDWSVKHGAAVIIAAIIGILLYSFFHGFRTVTRHSVARLTGEIETRHIVLQAIAQTHGWVLIIVSFCVVVPYSALPSFAASGLRVLLTAAVILQSAAWTRTIILGVIEQHATEKNSEILINAMTIIRLLVSVALFGIAAVIILDNVGVNVTGLIAGLGIGGIAIGLAAQGIFSDLFAALSIIFDNPFRGGDTIRYDQTIATVEHIGMKSTRLRSVNGEQLVISNTNLLDKEIANFARLKRRRVHMTLGFVYQTSPDMLRAVPSLLERVVNDNDHQFLRAGFIGFGDSSLDFELLFNVLSADYNVVVAARTHVGIGLFETLTNAGYDFAYPTRTFFVAATQSDSTAALPTLPAAPADPSPSADKAE